MFKMRSAREPLNSYLRRRVSPIEKHLPKTAPRESVITESQPRDVLGTATKVSRVKDFAGGDDASPLGVPSDDTLSRFHDNGCGDRIDISPLRHCTTFLASQTRHHLDEESLS